MKVFGLGNQSAEQDLSPVAFDRNDPKDGEIAFDILYCGVCHSDLHQVRNDWENTIYPCVPGHEIVGKVTQVGQGVKRFKEGDLIGVGCMVDSCQQCEKCESGEENYCQGTKSCTLTYNGPKIPDGSNTYGGYSTAMVVREEFALTIPDNLDPKSAGPIMCAGITVYSPMRHWNLEKGQRLGVAGIGGLGHMAIKIGKALGAEVVAFTRDEGKKQKILDMGADDVVISTDDEQMKKAAASLDLLINTIPVPHELDPYVSLMKTDSTIVVVGNVMSFPEFSPGPLVFNRIGVVGSLIGGVKETQEILDLCAKHDITPNLKMIAVDDVNDVLTTLEKGNDADFRHVIDMESLRKHKAVVDNTATEIDAPKRA